MFAAMLLHTFKGCDRGVYISFAQTGKSLTFNDCKPEVFETILHEFLFADGCALGERSHKNMQYMIDTLPGLADLKTFGLKISLAKTEAMFQSSPSRTSNAPQPPPVVILD